MRGELQALVEPALTSPVRRRVVVAPPSPHTPPALLIGGGQDLATAATDVLVYWSLLPARKLRLALDSQNKRIIPIENSRNDWMVCAWRYFFLSVLIGIDRLTGTIAPRVGSLAALCARVMTSVRT